MHAFTHAHDLKFLLLLLLPVQTRAVVHVFAHDPTTSQIIYLHILDWRMRFAVYVSTSCSKPMQDGETDW